MNDTIADAMTVASLNETTAVGNWTFADVDESSDYVDEIVTDADETTAVADKTVSDADETMIKADKTITDVNETTAEVRGILTVRKHKILLHIVFFMLSLCDDVLRTVACSIVGSRVDYCNSLLAGMSKSNSTSCSAYRTCWLVLYPEKQGMTILHLS